MSKLSSYRRIYEQDYQGANADLVKQLATPINASFSEIYDLANNNITFGDNLNCTIASFSITTDTTGRPLNATQFKLATYQTAVKGLWVINAQVTNNNTVYPPGAVGVSFTKSENSVLINNVKGLSPNINYTLTVIAIS